MTLAYLNCLGVVHWLADCMANITLSCFPNWLANRVRYLFRPRLIHRFAYGVALLAGLVHRFADRIWYLFRPRLIHRFAYGVALLAGLVHRFADRIRYLFRPRLIHRFAHGVRNCSCTSLPGRLADCVFHVSEALLLFVANAVNFLLLYNFFADSFVTGVLLLLVDDILDKPGTTA